MTWRPRFPRVTMTGLAAGVLLLGAAVPAAAQLAPSAWPMLQRDARHSGQGSFLGPLFPTGAPGPEDVSVWQSFGLIASSPTLAADGTIYVGVDVPRPGTSAQGWLCAIHPDMTERWCVQTRASASRSSAAVAADGTVYLGDRDNTLTAFDPITGAKKCTYNHGYEGDIHTSPTIRADGTVYFSFSQNLYGNGVFTALNPNCSLKWKYVIGAFMDASSPAIDPAGFIYMGDVSGRLHKFQDNGTFVTRIWKSPLPIGTKITASPVIAPDGTIYVGSTNGLSAVRPSDGSVLWNFPGGIVEQTPALGADGTVYFGAKSGTQRVFYAVSKTGALRWQYGPVLVSSPHGGFPILGGDGIVYVGFGSKVLAFSPDGVALWSHDAGTFIASHPAIAGSASTQTGGTAALYVASADWKLHAISSPRHGTDTNQPPTASAGPDQSTFVGRVVEFSASASDGNDDDVLSYTWDFGDGKTATGPTAHHPYVAPGTYTVTLTVSDGLSTATDSATVAVAPSGGPMSFTDNFNRPNAPSLDNGWEEAQGDFVIQGNEARNAASKNTHIAIQPASSGLAHAAGATFASVDNNTAPRVGIILRFIDPQNYYLFYRQMGGSSVLRIARIANGIETTLVSIGTPQAVVNTPFRLTADATGDKLVLRLCHATDTSTTTVCSRILQEVKATDAALAGGSVGVLLGTGSGATQQYRLDNFTAQVR